MKLNIISDIHAIYDPKQDKVLYNLQQKYTDNKYKDAAAQLLKFWTENIEELKKTEFQCDSIYESFPECFVIKDHDLAIKWLSDFAVAAERNFNSVSKDKAYQFCRALSNIDDHVWRNHIDWKGRNCKTKVSIHTLVDWMYKKLFDFHPEKLEPADYLIIAGDLGMSNTYDKILADITKRTESKFKKILHIAGNHDHWWHSSQSASNTKKPDTPNFDNDYCEHSDGEYVFLGCTLWTPIPNEAAWRIARSMNDYIYTPGKFTPYESRQQFEVQSKWLRDKIEANKDKKVIVFTHHQPFEELIPDKYKSNINWSDANEAYVVMDHSLDDINKYGNIKLWCCGHTHENFDGMLHGVHVVRNPIGYGDMYGQIPTENPSETWYNKIIEV